MCRPSLIVKLAIASFVFLILGVASFIHAERPNSTAGTSNAVTRKLLVDPSSTSVALGKASLIVGPVTHRDGNYVGDYQLKVRPYFFTSEKGTLLLAASDDSVRKVQAGTAIDFTGKAVTRKGGKTHVVLGKATPQCLLALPKNQNNPETILFERKRFRLVWLYLRDKREP